MFEKTFLFYVLLTLLIPHIGYCNNTISLLKKDKTEGSVVSNTESLERKLIEKEKLFYQLADDIANLKMHLGYKHLWKVCLESAQEVFFNQMEDLKQVYWKKVMTRLAIEKRKSSLRSLFFSRSVKFMEDETDVKKKIVRPSISATDRIFSITNTINATSKQDKHISRLYDIVVLKQNDTDVIVVTDWNNQCVKSFWFDPLQDREFSSRWCTDKVHTLAKLSETRIAVACQGNNKIYIINVVPVLSLHSTINSNSNNLGIHALTSQTLTGSETRLVIGHYNGLSVINLRGEMIKSMEIDIAGRKYARNPFFLTVTTTGNIIVSDETNGLICITEKRQILWNYTLKNPHDIDCDDDGNVYVADYNTNKVILVSSNGTFVKDVLSTNNGIAGPCGLHYDSIKGRLYVAENQSGLIKIFQHQRRR